MTGLNSTNSAPLSPLLLIDDDQSLASLIAEYCAEAGFSIFSALSGEEGIRVAKQHSFQMIILDVMLPGIDGFDVLQRLRQFSTVPVLMLTTRGAAMDRVRGLDGGADDYLAKPFQPEELVARIKTILRRSSPKEMCSKYVVGDLEIDEVARSVKRKGIVLELTGAEFHLLKLLLSQPGEPMPREELIPRIFGREPGSLDRSIDNLVNNLRKKLGEHAEGKERIKSIRNVGYSYVLCDGGSALS
ncbi:response regulator transcription factor [Terriglobus saanensis]|uniref:Two component transcriptional regulator, winged helix family n=1 Tax=Terriglobus saanensis (strain ATCC BAA-1853 / DSM 23119 / SP1PR4) TaxID=401053 RepID=E8UYN9_TERSS|nr:response regulator transcription factor [Terriglobus saanensis]ADV83192.1 two component transcriptional regulator, winged helix family [Terriglobus saanensis SP1PR4]